MIVMIEWNPQPWVKPRNIWVEYVPIRRAASKIGRRTDGLRRILEQKGKYETGFAVVYTKEGATREGKGW